METMINRALRLGHTSLWQTISKKDDKIPGSGFYGPVNRNELRGAERQRLEDRRRSDAVASRRKQHHRLPRRSGDQPQLASPKSRERGQASLGSVMQDRTVASTSTIPAPQRSRGRTSSAKSITGRRQAPANAARRTPIRPRARRRPRPAGPAAASRSAQSRSVATRASPAAARCRRRQLRNIMEYAGRTAGVNTEIFAGIEGGHHRHLLDRMSGGIGSADVTLRDPTTGQTLNSRKPEDRAKMCRLHRSGGERGCYRRRPCR